MTLTAILSALPEEQQGLIDLLAGASTVRHAGRDFHTGGIAGQPVVLGLSRIGKVAAATTATLLAERVGATRIVFTGVAGGLGAGVNVGDVVVAGDLLQHDMDASPLFPRFEVPLYGRAHFPADAGLAARLDGAARQALADPALVDGAARARHGLHAVRVHRGLLVSGDRFVAAAHEARALRAALPGALAVDMESAAVAQVCWDLGLPFAAVRTISDRADETAHVDFPAFAAEVAGRYACAILTRFFAT